MLDEVWLRAKYKRNESACLFSLSSVVARKGQVADAIIPHPYSLRSLAQLTSRLIGRVLLNHVRLLILELSQ